MITIDGKYFDTLEDYLDSDPGLKRANDQLHRDFISGHVYFYDKTGDLLEDRVTTSYAEHCTVRDQERNTVGKTSDSFKVKDAAV